MFLKWIKIPKSCFVLFVDPTLLAILVRSIQLLLEIIVTEVNFASSFVNKKDIEPKICQLIVLRKQHPKRPDESEQLKTLRDPNIPTKVQSSANEYMETFELDASDDRCIPRQGIKQDETVDSESERCWRIRWLVYGHWRCILKQWRGALLTMKIS